MGYGDIQNNSIEKIAYPSKGRVHNLINSWYREMILLTYLVQVQVSIVNINTPFFVFILDQYKNYNPLRWKTLLMNPATRSRVISFLITTFLSYAK